MCLYVNVTAAVYDCDVNDTKSNLVRVLSENMEKQHGGHSHMTRCCKINGKASERG